MSSGRLEARLFVLSGADLARSFTLAERSLVGRAEECEVVLSDRSISRKHALVAQGTDGWFVQDLGSTNGLSRAGQRLERLALQDGDEFKLGDLALRFRLVPADEESLEFAAPAAPAAPVAPAAAARPRSAPEPDADEIELEIELDDAPAARTGPAPAPRAPEAQATQFRARAERSSGLLAGELEQRPFWLRSILVLLAGLGAAALAYGLFLAVRLLRAG